MSKLGKRLIASARKTRQHLKANEAMATIQRAFEWYSAGSVATGRSVYTSDPEQLPQPLYTDPANSFQWLPMVTPLWLPRKLFITYCLVIFEALTSDDQPTWDGFSAPQKLLELDMWIDPAAKTYLGANPPGSEAGGQDRVMTIFHDWGMANNEPNRFYSQLKTFPTPYYLNRDNNDHLNFEFGNNYDLAWCVVEIGFETDSTAIIRGY